MNYQKRLISIFRTFVQKNLIPQIRKIDGNLQDWARFNSMLNSEIININELQIYVDSLPLYPVIQIDRKQMVFSARKKQQSSTYIEGLDSAFNPHRTFGGERSKGAMQGLRQHQTDIHNFSEPKRESQKQIGHKDQSQGKQFHREDSFRKTANMIPNNIGNASQQSNSASNILFSLDRLFRQLMDNHQKIQALEQNKGYI